MKRMRTALIENGRATEWVTSAIIMVFAITLSMPGDTLAAPTFRAFREAGLDEAAVSTPMALIGGARMVALYVNGNWRRSPYLRMVGAVLGSAIFGAMSLALLWPTIRYGIFTVPMTSGVGTYFMLSLADLFSSYRSGADARISRVPGH